MIGLKSAVRELNTHVFSAAGDEHLAAYRLSKLEDQSKVFNVSDDVAASADKTAATS